MIRRSWAVFFFTWVEINAPIVSHSRCHCVRAGVGADPGTPVTPVNSVTSVTPFVPTIRCTRSIRSIRLCKRRKTVSSIEQREEVRAPEEDRAGDHSTAVGNSCIVVPASIRNLIKRDENEEGDHEQTDGGRHGPPRELVPAPLFLGPFFAQGKRGQRHATDGQSTDGASRQGRVR